MDISIHSFAMPRNQPSLCVSRFNDSKITRFSADLDRTNAFIRLKAFSSRLSSGLGSSNTITVPFEKSTQAGIFELRASLTLSIKSLSQK